MGPPLSSAHCMTAWHSGGNSAGPRMRTPPPPRAGVGKPSMDWECTSGCTWSTARATARLRDSRPWSSQTGQVTHGSVDTTKTHLGPQRARMSSGERPIGAAKGKQSDTEALCQTPPRNRTSWGPKAAVREGSPTAFMGCPLGRTWPTARAVALLRVDPDTEQ